MKNRHPLSPSRDSLTLVALAALAFLPAGTARAQQDAPAATCEPQCRVGFTCVEGQCRSLCNPPCGAGLYCTEQRMCALVPTVPMAESPPPPPRRYLPPDPELLQRREQTALRVQERAQARQRARAAREIRLGLRETPRLTLAVGAGYQQLAERIENDGLQRIAGGYGGTIGLGLRKNFHRLLGAHADVTSFVGKASISDRGGVLRDDTFAMSLGVGGGAYFSTPWRLYFGPVASIDYRFYGKDTLTMFGRPYQLNPDGPIHGTIGGEVGFLLTEREQLDISLRVAAGLPEKMPNVFLSARYHFLPQSL